MRFLNPLETYHNSNVTQNQNPFHFENIRHVPAILPTRNIHEITSEGVNHIVAAHFIKSVQVARSKSATSSNESKRNAVDELMQVNNNVNNNSSAFNANAASASNNMNTNNLLNNANMLNSSNSSFTPNINDFTNIQLNTVNDMMKKLKENKISDMLHSEVNEKKEEVN